MTDGRWPQCWACEGERLERMPPTFPKHHTWICQACGLIQRRARGGATKEVARELDFYAGGERYLKFRQLHDASRHEEYRRVLEENFPLTGVRRSLDVGGAEGLFSAVLRAYHPLLEAHTLDPDFSCHRFAGCEFPEQRHHHATIETFESDLAFDLVTDFGAIYRSLEPARTLEKYRRFLNPEGRLFLTLGAAIENMGDSGRGGEAPDSLELAQPPQEVSVLSHFDLALFREFLASRFEIQAEGKLQALPYKKWVPWFLARPLPESECDPTRPRRAGRYLANREFLLGYETELSRERTRALRAEGMERVAIVGLTEEAHRLAELCREAGIEVTGFVTPQRYKLHKVELPFRPLRDFEAFFDTSLDAILLADAQGETTWLELLQTLHLPDRVPLIRTLDTASAKAALFKEHDGERFLNRAFRFSPATVARRPAGAAV